MTTRIQRGIPPFYPQICGLDGSNAFVVRRGYNGRA